MNTVLGRSVRRYEIEYTHDCMLQGVLIISNKVITVSLLVLLLD